MNNSLLQDVMNTSVNPHAGQQNPASAMSRFVREITINNKKFTVRILPTRQGLSVAKELSKVLVPVIASAMGESGGIDYSFVAQTLVENSEDFDEVNISILLLHGATVNGQELDFDQYFAGNYGEYLTLMAFVLEENFKSFFTASAFKEKVDKYKERLAKLNL